MLKKNSVQEGGSVEEFIGRIQMWKCSSGGIREKEMQSCAMQFLMLKSLRKMLDGRKEGRNSG